MTRLNGASVVVTGASGFVGPYVVSALHAAGARVHGCGLGEAPPHGPPLSSWRRADLTDEPTLRATLVAARPDAVVHLAGQSSAAKSFVNPEETFRANVVGTWHLLQSVLATGRDVRTLIVGSSEIYGPCEPPQRVPETAPLRPLSPYALSKAAADQLALAVGAVHGLEVIRVRAFGHTGPGQTPAFAVPAWAKQLAAIERGELEPILRVGNLDVTRDLSDVRDVARAYVALLQDGRPGEAYNVCRGEGVRLADIVEALRSKARVAIEVRQDRSLLRPADIPYLVGDPTAIERDTGWRCEIPLERTLDDVTGSFR